MDKTQMTTFPPAWKKNDRISIVAPSFVFDTERIRDGLDLFRSLGFEPHVPEGLSERDGYFAGPDAHRATLLSQALTDPNTTGVICARGGYGAARLLPSLPYEHLRKNPKLLVGFSDITALSLGLYAKLGLCSLHGPMIGTLRWDDTSTQNLIKLATGKPAEPLKLHEPVVLSHGTTEGTLLGGNLCLIASLVGTPYFPNFDGAILYLEDVDEKPYRVDRMLTQLELAGVLDKISGALVGDFAGCEDPNYPEPSWLTVIERRLAKRGVPVLAGFPGGHRKINWPLLIGAKTKIDASLGVVTLLEALS
jgi:muramoyltetrapeptide carboxypeptidase